MIDNNKDSPANVLDLINLYLIADDAKLCAHIQKDSNKERDFAKDILQTILMDSKETLKLNF